MLVAVPPGFHVSNLLRLLLADRLVLLGRGGFYNIEHHNDIFEEPLTKKEILEAIKSLKNNKSTSFDMVSNEMLKASMPALLDPIFKLFSTMIKNSLYSNYWKSDILSPVHKKGVKNDVNNYCALKSKLKINII